MNDSTKSPCASTSLAEVSLIDLLFVLKFEIMRCCGAIQTVRFVSRGLGWLI